MMVLKWSFVAMRGVRLVLYTFLTLSVISSTIVTQSFGWLGLPNLFFYLFVLLLAIDRYWLWQCQQISRSRALGQWLLALGFMPLWWQHWHVMPHASSSSSQKAALQLLTHTDPAVRQATCALLRAQKPLWTTLLANSHELRQAIGSSCPPPFKH